MCGIFGAVSAGRSSVTVDTIIEMAIVEERRGPHAFGLAWIDSSNRIRMKKVVGRVSNHLDAFDHLHGAKAVVGHTRYATHGDISNMANNHPHPCDGGWYVHNGQIHNFDAIIDEYDLPASSECDSEVIGLAADEFVGNLRTRMACSIDCIDVTYPACVAGIWSRPGRVMVARRGNPMSYGHGRAGNVYFASLPGGIPGLKGSLRPDTLFEYTVGKATPAKTERLRPFRSVGRVVAGSGSSMATTSKTRTIEVPVDDVDPVSDFLFRPGQNSECCGAEIEKCGEFTVCGDCCRDLTSEGRKC